MGHLNFHVRYTLSFPWFKVFLKGKRWTKFLSLQIQTIHRANLCKLALILICITYLKPCRATRHQSILGWNSTLIQVERYNPSFTTVGGTLVVAGGMDTSSVEMLRPGQTVWKTASWPLKEGISQHCAVAWPGSSTELVVLGGINRKAFRF